MNRNSVLISGMEIPPMKMTGIRHFIEVNGMELTVSSPVLMRK